MLAPQAGAYVLHLPNGRAVSIARHAPAGDGTLSAPPAPVLSSGSILGSAGAAGPSAHFAPDYESIVNQFLGDVGADSGATTNVYGVSARYGAGTSATGAYQSSFAGQIDDSSAYPTGGCTPAGGYTSCITDAQVQTELTNIISARHLPGGTSAMYFVMLPPGVDECFDSAGTQCADTAFCAYHGNVGSDPSGGPIYAVEPYAGVSGCEGGQSPQTGSSANPGPDAAASILSHEHNEAITDPLVSTTNGSWYDSKGNEIGDKCSYVFGTATGGTSGAEYNQAIAGNHYWLQDEFANSDGSNTKFDNCQQHPGATGDGVSTSLSQTRTALGYHGGPVMGAHSTYTIYWDPADTATPPDGTFTASTSSVQAGIPMSFTAKGTTDPQGGALSYLWSFGDGATSTAANPSHTYALNASCRPSCTVRLKVTDTAGYWGTSVQRIAVTAAPPPTARFTATPSPAPLSHPSVSFDAGASTSVATITTYQWDFGDGATATSAAPTTSHTYAAAGSYTVKLTVTDSNSDADTVTSTAVVQGLSPSITDTVAAPGQPTTFGVTNNSVDPISTYSWSFGDPGSGSANASTASAPTHTYGQPGSYTVSVTVSDGVSTPVTTTTAVSIPASALSLVSSFTSNPAPAVAGSATSFTATSSPDPVVKYAWDFGDGATSGQASPSHVYASPGSYPVRLTVTDGGGITSQSTMTVQVLALVADFTVSPAPSVGQAETFMPAASPDPISSYAWAFGDGATSTAASPSHVYANPGIYTVTLSVTDANGVTSVAAKSLSVAAVPGGAPAGGGTLSATSGGSRPAGGVATGATVPSLATLLMPGRPIVQRSGSRLLLGGGARLGCAPAAAAPCRVAVLLTTVQRIGSGRHAGRRTVTLATATLTIAPGATVTLRIPLRPSGAALLARSHRLTARLVITAFRGAAPVALTRRTLVLTAPAARRAPRSSS